MTSAQKSAPPTHLMVPFKVVAAVTSISGILGRGFTMCGTTFMAWGPHSNEDWVHLYWGTDKCAVYVDMELYHTNRTAFYAILGLTRSVGFEVREVLDLVSVRDTGDNEGAEES